MSHQKLLQQVIGVTLAALLLVGCGAPTATPTSVPPTPTSTSTPTPTNTPTNTPRPTNTPQPTNTPTLTPTATNTNTPTPTSTPAPTATPVAGIGVPVADSRWQVTVEGARQEIKLTGFDKTYTPKDDYTLLIVEATFRNLNSTQQTKLSSDAIAVISEDGEIIVAKGLSFGEIEIYLLGDAVTISIE